MGSKCDSRELQARYLAGKGGGMGERSLGIAGTGLPTHAPGATGVARSCGGSWREKCLFYKKRGGKAGLLGLASGACETIITCCQLAQEGS